MGAIQQALNQSLALGAIAVQPMAQMKTEIKTAEKGIKTAQNILDKTLEKKQPTDAEIDIAMEGAEAAYKKLYTLKPSEKTLKDFTTFKEGVEELKRPPLTEEELNAAHKYIAAPAEKAQAAVLTRKQQLQNINNQMDALRKQGESLKWEIKKEARKK